LNSRRRTRTLTAVGAAAVLALLGAGSAFAVSSGGYSPAQQNCPANADAVNAGQPGARQHDAAVSGCHNFAINVEDASGNRYVQFGIDQIANNSDPTPTPQDLPHAFDISIDLNGAPPGTPTSSCGATSSGLALHIDVTNPSGAKVTPVHGAPTLAIVRALSGATIYLGADDNLDFGEHDGVTETAGTQRAANGPSDGGALVLNMHPSALGAWLDSVQRGDSNTLLTNPVPVADAGAGGCADGFCVSVQTRQRTVYEGGNPHQRSRNAYDYSGKQWDPYSCSSGSQQSQSTSSCGGHTMDYWRRQEAQQVNAEPGVQVYEDPDPQASPIDPAYEAGLTSHPTDYPTPAVYAGTCGVVAGGGVASLPAGTPGTNSAGQLRVSTGC